MIKTEYGTLGWSGSPPSGSCSSSIRGSEQPVDSDQRGALDHRHEFLIIKDDTYDGHGRLIRIHSPFPDPWTMTGDDFRTERLYYDGIRRIQEVIVDPVQGNSNGEDAEGEGNQIGGGTEHMEREYVWGPGDNGFDDS